MARPRGTARPTDGQSSASAPTDDAALVDAFRQGDEDAFGRITRSHFRELHVHCYRMVGSFDEAEDLVGEQAQLVGG